jgi:hypothetical protein
MFDYAWVNEIIRDSHVDGCIKHFISSRAWPFLVGRGIWLCVSVVHYVGEVWSSEVRCYLYSTCTIKSDWEWSRCINVKIIGTATTWNVVPPIKVKILINCIYSAVSSVEEKYHLQLFYVLVTFDSSTSIRRRERNRMPPAKCLISNCADCRSGNRRNDPWRRLTLSLSGCTKKGFESLSLCLPPPPPSAADKFMTTNRGPLAWKRHSYDGRGIRSILNVISK